jgi:hypothetical protein
MQGPSPHGHATAWATGRARSTRNPPTSWAGRPAGGRRNPGIDVGPEAAGRHAGMRSSVRAALRQRAGPWRSFLLTSLGWLIISIIVLRFTHAPDAAAGALLGVM